MRPRKEVTEFFSTFVRFESERFGGWIADAQLRRSMGQCLKQPLENVGSEVANSDLFWSLYWYQLWQSQVGGLSGLHLSAYLQEPCYWAAQKTARKITSTQYGLSDCFQLAIAELPTILKGFKPERGHLKSYAEMAFRSLLRDILRQRQEADLCTHWTLLRKVGKRRLMESLSHAGLSTETMAQYQLAWMCFKKTYVQSAPASGLPTLNPSFWAAVATLYNKERLGQLDASGQACDAATIETWLVHCALAVRKYLYPPISSLQTPRSGTDSNEVLEDLLSVSGSEGILAEIIAQEDAQIRQEQQSQIYKALVVLLEQLAPELQQVLSLHYQEGLTQKEMKLKLNKSQPTISRCLNRAHEQLLIALVTWSQETLNISPDANQIGDMGLLLKEWLECHYGGSARSAQ
ncbi:MAG: sigma-70 family RNA polymerase sigma factor [Timaviella obliquedivisa GSE-PSE-MK23-08B]|jgi:RNA polymerase sigma factor (sigma-70 family)|nr:sigma-70 family RNA polymerase sigma factor [Timaviella obliquedivisa GSE-PSE-MK23-08B]